MIHEKEEYAILNTNRFILRGINVGNILNTYEETNRGE